MSSDNRIIASHLLLALFLYLLFASLDLYFTINGIGGDLTLEGNPLMRAMMRLLGPLAGIVVEKSLVLTVVTVAGILSAIGIRDDSEWIYRLALTRMTREWMKKRKRYWVAFLPLYLVAAGQGVAAASWMILLYTTS